ncbi:hypothetical protein LY76DRAFT_244123 [Colletotrichum caudatum]|nr:hypothetical protein LY76DRAFT_244123 [Colletotrichum caudatum]
MVPLYPPGQLHGLGHLRRCGSHLPFIIANRHGQKKKRRAPITSLLRLPSAGTSSVFEKTGSAAAPVMGFVDLADSGRLPWLPCKDTARRAAELYLRASCDSQARLRLVMRTL